jgi:methyl-accepting chemotaxis protein
MTPEQQYERAIKDFAWGGTKTFLLWVCLISPFSTYLVPSLVGLSAATSGKAVLVLVPPLIALLAVGYPYVQFRWLGGLALRPRPGDRPGDRLNRLLTLPWYSTLLLMAVVTLVGGGIFCAALVYLFNAPLERISAGMVVVLSVLVVLSFPVSLGLERRLLPQVLEEHQKHPEVPPRGGGPFWPRQVWYLPFAVGLSTVATLALAALSVAVELLETREALRTALSAGRTQEALALLDEQGASSRLTVVLVVVGGLLPAVISLTTWILARRQAQGAQAIRESIESLASGRVQPPRWLSTDELGDLAGGLSMVLERLRRLPRTLQDSASRLVSAGDSLSEANLEQQQSLTRQAAALQQAQVTSEEIKQVSLMASQRAEAVLQVARRAEELGKSGETSIEQSMAGLGSIQQYVESLRQQLTRLQESTTRISTVAITVKELADRSNMLALNAAIEAVRSGEHGKGFAVVAKEIRTLANRSIVSTNQIREMLEEVVASIGQAASMGESGAEQIARDMARMRSSSDNLRELTRISKETSGAVQQIAAAVSQQNAGFSQIFSAIGDLSQIMQQTIKRLDATQGAVGTLKVVSGEVDQVARQFTAS